MCWIKKRKKVQTSGGESVRIVLFDVLKMFFLLLNAKAPQPATKIPLSGSHLCQKSTLRYIIIRKSVQEEGVAGFLNYYPAVWGLHMEGCNPGRTGTS